MRITIHFDFKPSVTITKCEVTLVTLKNGYLLIKPSEDSEWDMLFDGDVIPTDNTNMMILRLYNDGTCCISQAQMGYYKITGMSAIEVSEKEFND
jgi:hypothetical protein